jgi:hypothetical protein
MDSCLRQNDIFNYFIIWCVISVDLNPVRGGLYPSNGETKMNNPKFSTGQRVKIIPVAGYDPEVDRILGRLADKAGKVEKSYCISPDEMPDRIKMFGYPDVFSYDIRPDEGNILRGIPEIALEPDTLLRK